MGGSGRADRVFGRFTGFGPRGLALSRAAAVLAGASGYWPLGRFSAKRDRRHLIIGACIVAALSGIAMAVFADNARWAPFALIILFGGMAFPLYAVCVAHMNDFVAPGEFVEASSVMLLIYAAGASLGAIPASILMGEIGPQGLFVFTAAGHIVLAIFTLHRLRARKAHSADEIEPFVGVPRTSPALYALDPRSDGLEQVQATEEQNLESTQRREPKEE